MDRDLLDSEHPEIGDIGEEPREKNDNREEIPRLNSAEFFTLFSRGK